MLHSRAAAEDAVQEAFLLAWRNRHVCRSPDAPLPWLLQITRNEALRALRSSSRRTVPADTVEEPAGEDRDLAHAPERLDVREALACLSREDRRLLELRYVSDMTQPSVAARLGIPEGTVKVRLHRLRSRLRVTLEAQA